MLPNNFIFSQAESLFQSKLDSNEIKNEAIAFMADTGRIWTHGTWFATPLTAEDIQNLIEGSTTLVEYIQTLSPAEVSVSDTQPSGEEKIWVNGNSISFKTGDSWSTPIDFDNFLSKDNTLEYTPAGDYNPATKKYVDDQITKRDNVLIIDYTDLVGSPIDETVVSNIIKAAQEGKAVILKAENNLFNVTVGYTEASNTLELDIYTIAPQENGYDLSIQSIIINTLDNTLISNTSKAFTLVNTGDGLKYLSDDGTYKTFPDMATVVELNSAVLALTNESSSEDIIAAFDSAAQFSNLILQIRDSDNIVNEVLLDTDGYIGHINASLAVSKTDEIIHIRFIDNNGKLVFITVTNNAGTFSCTRVESELGGGSQDNIKYISIDNISEGTGTIDEDIATTLNSLQNGDILIGTSNVNKAAIVISYHINNNDFYGSYILTGGAYPDITIGSLFINLSTKTYSLNPINIDANGDGSKFLSNDGKYKTIEVGDKTNVLILSLENDLANGQKDSPVDAEVSTALKDAISTGKACVIKSANSDILANLQQIGDNVTIVMEQISRVGQTFVAVNTTITVNTATNIISDYQTGAIVLETEGDGTKFLSDDGTYKTINVEDEVAISGSEPSVSTYKLWVDTTNSVIKYSNGISWAELEGELVYYLDINNFSEQSGTISSTLYNEIKEAIESGKVIIVTAAGGDYKYTCELTTLSEGKDFQIFYATVPGTVGISILSDYSYTTFTQELVTDNDVLTKTNTTEYTPTGDYHPATKKYVDSIAPRVNNVIAEIQNIGTDVNLDPLSIAVDLSVKKQDIIVMVAFAQDPSIDPVYIYTNLIVTGTGYHLICSPIILSLNNKDLVELSISSSGSETSGIVSPTITIKSKYIQRTLTKSEYSALGGSTASDNVLYFITPD